MTESDLHFSLENCDDVINQCFQTSDAKTIDFEIIPRHENNYIFRITFNHGLNTEMECLYVKSKSKVPRIDKILSDFKHDLIQFNPRFSPKFVCGKSELLFFEDLTCQKFQTNPEDFDLKHIEQVLTVLADFHAAGLAYEKVTEKQLKDKYKLGCNNFDLKKLEDLIWHSIENKERVDEIRKELEQRQLSGRFTKTLCHSNLTSNNILFHYENGVPNQCKLINFKASLYAPPVYDVLQLIFLTTEEHFRLQNLEHYLIFYHEKLKKSLQIYNLDVDNFVTIEELKLSSHYLLPLIKLEAAIAQKNPKSAATKLQEILQLSDLTIEDCYVILKNCLESTDYQILSFQQQQILPSLSKFKVKVRHSSDEKVFSFFVKFAPEGDIFGKNFFIHNIFTKKLQNFGFNTLKHCLASCFFERFEHLLVFEDLTLLNFQPLSELHLDVDLLSLIVRNVARLHASTFLLEEQISEETKNTFYMSEHYKKYLKTEDDNAKIVELISEVMKLFPELKIGNVEDILKKRTSNRFKSVISHGSLSPKNILVKVENCPVACKFINFGRVTYCPPAFDFLSVVYLESDRSVRATTEEKLMELYHEELGKIMSSYNYNINEIFSYEEFIDSVADVRGWVALNNIFMGHNLEKFSSSLKSGNFVKDRLKKKVLDLCEIFL